jgi:hypothetical protein
MIALEEFHRERVVNYHSEKRFGKQTKITAVLLRTLPIFKPSIHGVDEGTGKCTKVCQMGPRIRLSVAVPNIRRPSR